MTADQGFRASLISSDIVTWNGVTSRWGAIKDFVCPGDLVRMPDDDEVFQYRRQEQKQAIIKHRHAVIYHEREAFGISGPYELLMDRKLHYSGWKNQVKSPENCDNISPLVQLEYNSPEYIFAFSYYTSAGHYGIRLSMKKEFSIPNSHQFIACINVFCKCIPVNAGTSDLTRIWETIIQKFDNEKERK